MAVIYIDNKPYEVKEGQSLLNACLSLGFSVPYFCWHPELHSVGACRQCAVKQFRNESDTRGFIIMSCMTPVEDGLCISIDDPEARQFRASIIEMLMLNHPHDCPVCDEGGECHLQDMTVMTGHVRRRTRFPKRTYRNQDLGPFLNHEMNRCIQCYRCLRFYRDYAGGRDFNVFGIHQRLYFGRYEDGKLESEFSGNLVEVCPTGVFTDKTFMKHFTRKWDLQTAPSICVHCSVGCNTIVGERYGTVRRILNRFNREVNGYFLCDRGRFGYEFVNSELRIRRPLVRDARTAEAQPANKAAALKRVAQILRKTPGLIGIGSPRASLESNYALRKLVGPDRFFAGVSGAEQRLITAILDSMRKPSVLSPSLQEVERADAVLLLGEDVPNTAPRLALALRQSVRVRPMTLADQLCVPRWMDHAVRLVVHDARGPLYIATPYRTRLDSLATKTLRGAPDDIARLGFAVAHELSTDSPAVAGLSEEAQSLAHEIAQALQGASCPLVMSGTGCGSMAVVQAADAVARSLRKTGRPAMLSFIVPECNSLGLGILGGGSLEDAVERILKGDAHNLIILQSNLFRRLDRETVEEVFEKIEHVVVLDHVANRCVERADVVLPSATFAESDGTFVNNEGRGQRFFQVMVPQGDVQASWRWIRDIADALDKGELAPWTSLDDLIADMAASVQRLKEVVRIAPAADFRMTGMRIARESHRYSGRTAVTAYVSVHEPKPPQDDDSPLAFSMEGFQGHVPPAVIPRFWSPGWNSIQAVNKFQSEVGGPLAGGDPGIRLIEPMENVEKGQEGAIVPEPFRPRTDACLLVPLFHVFGSEELSMLSPAIAEAAPEPYVGLSPEDADRLGLRDGNTVAVRWDETELTLPAKIMDDLPGGLAGLPHGLPGLSGFVLPRWGKIRAK